MRVKDVIRSEGLKVNKIKNLIHNIKIRWQDNTEKDDFEILRSPYVTFNDL